MLSQKMKFSSAILLGFVIIFLLTTSSECDYDDHSLPPKRMLIPRSDSDRFKVFTIYNNRDEKDDIESEEDEESSDSLNRRTDRISFSRTESPTLVPISTLTNSGNKFSVPSSAEVVFLDSKKILTKIAKANGQESKKYDHQSMLSSPFSEYSRRYSNSNPNKEYEDYESRYDSSYEDDDYREHKESNRGNFDNTQAKHMILRSDGDIFSTRKSILSDSEQLNDENHDERGPSSKPKKDKKVVLLFMGYRK
ncbi:uncharacterized protein LOC141850963 [Brevipalpus obovatus]|uniref:uncharacterized protein LOC141850963 n=1 Tax=Brevipalpus obovatus TaxID=246614 RepID=UPI003D9E1AF6